MEYCGKLAMGLQAFEPRICASVLMCSIALAQMSLAQPASDYSALIEKARVNGSVSIIVGLKVSRQNSPETDTQKEIARLQAELVERLKAHNVSNIRKYESIPFIAMKVDLGALKLLTADQRVSGIEEDITVEIQN